MFVNWEQIHFFICHLSGLSLHTHPLVSILEFSKPYELLYFELESLIKC